MKIGRHDFDTDNNAYIMGILNVTPDSFSDGGKWTDRDVALAHVQDMINEGATIIDVGGESTRPGYTRISDEEEIERTAPVIREIKKNFDITVSIDTYKSKVARAAIMEGADIVNDIWGLKADDKMAELVAKNDVSVVIMHNRDNEQYVSFMDDMISDLKESIDIAKKAGIADDKIIVDPGVGFAKNYEQNLMAINNVGRLRELGYPVLLATSRKSIVGLTLDTPKDERVEGTIVTTVFGAQQGCSFFRVHDVKENMRALLMTRAILGEK